jgi:hypothetical protein
VGRRVMLGVFVFTGAGVWLAVGVGVLVRKGDGDGGRDGVAVKLTFNVGITPEVGIMRAIFDGNGVGTMAVGVRDEQAGSR